MTERSDKQFAPTGHVRDAFLDARSSGMTLNEALDHVHVSWHTYRGWRRRYPTFKIRDDVAKGVKPKKISPQFMQVDGDSTFADKRYAYFAYESYFHHHAIIDAIETAPEGGVTLILLPPEHGKTTVVADYISILIAEEPNTRVGYISGGLGFARKAVGRQQSRMSPDGPTPRYFQHYGPFFEEGRDGKPWTTDYFTVLKSDHDEQDYTMEARGWTSRIAGARLDYVFIDDIQELRTLNQTEDMVEKFRQDILSRVSQHGKTVIIGTRVGERDFYWALIEADLIDKLVLLPATEGEVVDCPLGEKCDISHIPHEKPLCPEMWPAHALARKRKQVGENAWWRNFQQKPRNAKDQTFTEQMIEDARNGMATVSSVRERVRGWRRFAGLDPALTGGNSLMVCEATGQTIRGIYLDRQFNMVRTENILAEIDKAWRQTGFTDLTIEVNAYQKSLGNDERLRNLSRLRGFRIRPHTTGVNKADPDFGVASMASTFIDGLIEWPWGDQRSQDMFGVLEAELHAWREGVATKKIRQDTVMTLWFCWLFWQKRRKAWLTEDAKLGPLFTTRRVPWTPQGYEAIQQLARSLG